MEQKQAGNMAIWDRYFKTDPEYTKEFQGAGGFKGTAIGSMYSVKRATELFGPIGIGWGVQTVETKIESGIWFSYVKLWYKYDGKEGEVFAWAGTKFTYTTNAGKLMIDEEAAKKTQTDGMTKCLSLLGFSGDVHMGMFDDNKYVNSLKEESAAKKKAEEAAKPHNTVISFPKKDDDKDGWDLFVDEFSRIAKDLQTVAELDHFRDINRDGRLGLSNYFKQHDSKGGESFTTFMNETRKKLGG